MGDGAGDEEAPVAALGYCHGPNCKQGDITAVRGGFVPYSLYPRFCITLWHASAYCVGANPFYDCQHGAATRFGLQKRLPW